MQPIKKCVLAVGYDSPESKLPTKVLGEVNVELDGEQVASKVTLFAGANGLTLIELTVDGRWVAGVLSGHYSIQGGVDWLREAEAAMPAMRLLPADLADDLTVDSVILTKAISAIGVANGLAARRIKGREWSSKLQAALFAAAQMFIGHRPGFRQLRQTFRVIFPRVFERAHALRRARRLGALSPRWEALLSELTGVQVPQPSLPKLQSMARLSASDCTEPKAVRNQPPTNQSSSFNIKAMALGALILCLFPPVRVFNGITFGFIFGEESISLEHLIALLGAWSALVYLWPNAIKPRIKRAMGK
jgi:hypothetical protein